MITVDKDICIGCGACIAVCPQVFEMGKDGKSQVREQKNIKCVDEAIKACPVGAITK
ncbi:MAG: ferredoxin [Candidatus Aenigmarchaeota archaeon]|nr:ferredoxin [Candidatus Aenigmarchaeota archaeon]MCX8179723.1 ferredoxin [Candidatus Aenigmarchaeota archaeon]